MSKLNKSIFKTNAYVFHSFLITAICMLAVYLATSVAPFGENTVLRMDLYHQYGPLFAELYDRMTEGKSLIYSWNSGLGSCFLGNYFNYLSSPIAAIVLFFGHKNVTEAIAAMILIKAALASSAFTYYLKKSKNIANQSYASVAFGVLYAFCAYMLAYYWNVMWLDAMLLLPIVVLGIERIIDYGKPSFYIAALALTMFSNYYMSYMICMFSVIYFFYYYSANYSTDSKLSKIQTKNFVNKKLNSRFLRSCFTFGCASLMAGALMAVVLLPVYNLLQASSATGDTMPKEFSTYFVVLDFFANHFAGLTTTIRSSGDFVIPNVYCGILTILLAPLFFFTKTIRKKEKLTTLLLLAVLYVSFNFNSLNYLWHGMHFPNDLPYRFSFIYSFVLLVMAYKTFIRLDEFESRHFGAVGVGLFAFIILVEKLGNSNFNELSLVISLAFTIGFVLLLSVFKDKNYSKRSLAGLLLLLVCTETITCAIPLMSISVKKEGYIADYDNLQTIQNQLDEIENDEFYRMELSYLMTRMDPSLFGYNGVSVFSSMAYETVANLQSNLGMMSNVINSYTYNPQTPIYNMMFSLKYLVNNEQPNVLENSNYYTHVSTVDKFDSYSNNYYLPIAYQASTDLLDWTYEPEISRDVNPFEIQQDYFKKATGVQNDVFVPLELSNISYSNVNVFNENMKSTKFNYTKTNNDLDGSSTFYITAKEAGNIYIYYYVDGASESTLTVTTPKGTLNKNTRERRIMDLGYFNENEVISVNIPFEDNSGYVSLYAYTINNEVLKEGYDILTKGQLDVETFDDTYIKGTINSTQDSLLYTSIPYDRGWKVFIDGKEVSEDNIVKLGDALLAVNIKHGDSTIEFKYEVIGLNSGLIISIISAILLIIFLLLKMIIKKSRIRTGKQSNIPAYAAENNNCSYDVILPYSNVKDNIANTIYRIQNGKTSQNSLPYREIYKAITENKVLQEEELVKEVKMPEYDIMDIEKPIVKDESNQNKFDLNIDDE